MSSRSWAVSVVAPGPGRSAGLVAHHAREARVHEVRGSSRGRRRRRPVCSSAARLAAVPTAPLRPPKGSPSVPSQCSGSVFLQAAHRHRRARLVVRGRSRCGEARAADPPEQLVGVAVGMAAPAREGSRVSRRSALLKAIGRAARRPASGRRRPLIVPAGGRAIAVGVRRRHHRHGVARACSARRPSAARRCRASAAPRPAGSTPTSSRAAAPRSAPLASKHAGWLAPAAVTTQRRVVAADRDAVGRRELRAGCGLRRRRVVGVQVELA